MDWSDIPLSPPARTLRQFAGLWLASFAALAGVQGARHGWGAAAALPALLALGVGVPGLWRPRSVRWVFVGSMVLTFPAGWLTSRLLLAVLFHAVFTPLGLLFRLAGRDALNLRRRPGTDTWWVPRPAAAHVGRYFRQF
jgi:hypothetical protein